MQATITENFDLILRWHEGGESTVRFSIVNDSEFVIAGNVCWERFLNYQGEASVSFETMCYGYDLDQFALELNRLAQGGAESAKFVNTGEDFGIHIFPQERMGKQILVSELRYCHHRSVGNVSCDRELVLPVGAAEDVWKTAQSIREFIRLLKVDCRSLFELPKKRNR